MLRAASPPRASLCISTFAITLALRPVMISITSSAFCPRAALKLVMSTCSRAAQTRLQTFQTACRDSWRRVRSPSRAFSSLSKSLVLLALQPMMILTCHPGQNALDGLSM